MFHNIQFSGWLLFLLHFLGLLDGFVERRRHIINVSSVGSDDEKQCFLRGKNCTLSAAFRAVTQVKKFHLSTEIRIVAGDYQLNTSFSFYNISNLAITTTVRGDKGGARSVNIRCEGNYSSLSFFYCRDIVIQDISLISCGALHTSSSYESPLFYSAIFVNLSRDLTLSRVVIRASLGVGITMYDTTGNVTIDNSVFENNGPNKSSCQDSSSKNSLQDGRHIAKAGGGLYIEFTYNSPESYIINGSSYHIFHSKFIGNINPYPGLMTLNFSRPGGVKHVGFSRGGGLSLYMRGSARNNTFNIDSCIFERNHAIWGGGYFIQFLDGVQDNKVTIRNTNVTRNSACLGGGAFQLSTISKIDQWHQFLPDKIRSISCLFSSNSALSGGGGTVLGRTILGHRDSSYYFSRCIWERNEAFLGSAITMKIWDYGQGLFGPYSPFVVNMSDCIIKKNTVRVTATQEVGIGVVYDFLVPLFLKNVSFVENMDTSLVLDTASATIISNVTFSRNIGFKGGAVAMYGEASINLTKHSKLVLEHNVAKEKGGAIFVESPGPDNIAGIANNYLQTHECFIQYEEKYTNPNDWQAQVIFINNSAPLASGYSVFANSLQDCIYPGDANTSTVFRWSSFHYYVNNTSNTTLKRRFEITTDAVKIMSKESDWNVPPDQNFSPQITLLDEKNNSVFGMVRIAIDTVQTSSVKLGTPSSLFLVKDNISFLDLKGISGTNFSVKIRTVGGQLAVKSLNNLTLRQCSPGFIQKEKECVCLSQDEYSGVSRCSKDGHVYLMRGYWAGEIETDSGEVRFVTAQCPSAYCNCFQPDKLSLRTDECIYDSSQICRGNRMGVLCGSCKDGYTVKVGVQECSAECKNYDLWRLALLFVGLTFLVFFIFRINLDIFTCYMNSWLYFYQVIYLIMGVWEEVNLDPFIAFIIGLANITISGFGSCLWKGMDNLAKLGFSYVLPIYVFLVILVIGLVARKFPDSYFAKNSTFRASCTLFVLCYSTLTSVSMEILRPSKIGDTVVVFRQGTVKYFSSYHSFFAVPAILILLFVVIPFPFILMFTPFFIRRVRWVQYATPLFNTFQACFKDGYRWFAAFYFFSRFFFFVFATFLPYGATKAIIIQIVCVFVLATHVYLCPYLPQYDWINKLDSLLLATLTAISIISGQKSELISSEAKKSMITTINVLAYIPLVYVLCLASYLLYKWIKNRISLKTNSSEHSSLNFSNLEEVDNSSSA